MMNEFSNTKSFDEQRTMNECKSCHQRFGCDNSCDHGPDSWKKKRKRKEYKTDLCLFLFNLVLLS